MRPPFNRTRCDCAECVACCKRGAGPLAPGDYERIAEFLGRDVKDDMWASPGGKIGVVNKQTGEMQVVVVPTITPQMRDGRCVFLDANDRCSIHPVAPFGCAYFDIHMGSKEGDSRSIWLMVRQANDAEYQRLRSTLKVRP